MSRNLTRGMRGVTLIEMMIAIAVIALLMGLGMPSYSAWIQNQQIRTAAEAVKNGMQLARAEAVRRNANVELEFDALPASRWTARIAIAGGGGEQIQRRPSEDSPNSTLTMFTGAPGAHVADSDARMITLNGLGRVIANRDAIPTFSRVDIDSTVLAAEESRELSVRAGIGGDVRMCDPQVTTIGDPRTC